MCILLGFFVKTNSPHIIAPPCNQIDQNTMYKDIERQFTILDSQNPGLFFTKISCIKTCHYQEPCSHYTIKLCYISIYMLYMYDHICSIQYSNNFTIHDIKIVVFMFIRYINLIYLHYKSFQLMFDCICQHCLTLRE